MAYRCSLLITLGLLLLHTQVSARSFEDRVIGSITVKGNQLVSQDAILAKIPYVVGDRFRSQSDDLINSVLSLGHFNNVALYVAEDGTRLALIVVVDEKFRIEEIVFEGNDNLKLKDIEKEITLSDIKSANEEELNHLIVRIKKLYVEKSYHKVAIRYELVESAVGSGYVVRFIVDEGPISRVKRVFFTGNECVASKKLRSLIVTQEDWVFGNIAKAGIYQPEAIEYDKFVIENFYQNHGYLAARVENVTVDEDACGDLTVTYVINEGDIYTISEVTAEGNDILPEERQLGIITIRPGYTYSKELIRQSMENLRLVWGEFGYINAEVHPGIKPDYEAKTVAIDFTSDLGKPVTLNRITIRGNNKTRDNVIRRQLLINEYDKITTFKMEESKRNVERLGYFDQKNGVNWKVIPLDDERADLELMLKEVKTGQFYGDIGFGGIDDFKSPSQGFKVGAGFQDINFRGTGLQYRANLMYSPQDKIADFSLTNPWLFDRPLYGSANAYHRSTTYDEFRNVRQFPTEQITGGTASIGFTANGYSQVSFLFEGGAERICYPLRPIAVLPPDYAPLLPNFQQTLNNHFIPGTIVWLSTTAAQDKRNHPIFPSRGHQWIANLRFAIPHFRGDFGFVKLDLDAKWFTPLINEYDLVFAAHGHIGLVENFPDRRIPYRELYHIGGLATVRGFLFGQIGPSLVVNHGDGRFESDSLGGKKAFWINLELQFPVTSDMSIRGVLFYDGGAGWDTTNASCISPLLLRNNRFDYRHSIGFGLRLTKPTPIRIDWGFKLDRRKRFGEPASEMHFTALSEF